MNLGAADCFAKRRMVAKLFFYIFVLLVFAVLAFKSFVTIKEGEYVVIYRLGKLDRWSGPGATIIVRLSTVP